MQTLVFIAALSIELASVTLLALAFGQDASAADDDLVEVPPSAPATWKEFKVPVGRIISIQAKAGGKWLAIDTGLEIASCDGGKVANFSAPVADTYRAVYVGADGVKLFKIVVGDAPAPPKPPVPPNPPDPPVDKLTAELRLAIRADAASAADLSLLAELVATMVNESKSDTYVTAKQLNDTYKRTRDSLLKNADGSIRLPQTRARIGQEIAAIVDDDTAALTDDTRKRIAVAYASVADALVKAQK